MALAGELTKRVTIQKRTSVQGTGEAALTWTDWVSLWAAPVGGSGGETPIGPETHAEGEMSWRVRYMRGITEADRLKFTDAGGARYFEILHVENVDEAGREMVLTTREVRT